MKLDICRTPFSKYGSYFSVMQESPGGPLVIRILRNWLDKEKFCELAFESNGLPAPIRVEAEPHQLRIISQAGGEATLVLHGEEGLAVECHGLDLRLVLCKEQAGYGYRESDRCFKLMSSSTGLFAKLDVVAGEPEAQLPVSAKDWFGRPPTQVTVRGVNNRASIYLESSTWDLLPGAPPLEVKAVAHEVDSAWQAFRKKMPPAFESHRSSCEWAWYVMWSSFVPAGGNFHADACLMSKTGMGAVWSWDHCFNAMALADADLPLALSQFMLPFALQAPTGQLPDRFTARETAWTWVKPPIHGWTLSRLLARHSLEPEQMRAIYSPLAKWTNWWMDHRDTDADGVPNYIFGCDVADNATLFAEESFLLEAPDLSANLVLQMLVLSDLARSLGDMDATLEWRKRADTLLSKMEDHLWNGDRFVARISGLHTYQNPPTSSVPFRVLILGDLLDRKKFNATVALLEKEHLTPHGLSSEALSSPLYEDDGYARGSIWAPEVYMICDGLCRGGRRDLAVEIASRFCAAVANSGFYECFNAKTGEGQRAVGYTWTASVYLLLVRDFLAS